MIEAAVSLKLSRNEGLKEGNPLLSGNIAAALSDPAADHFSDDDYEFLKFHGVYQQDDRDKRKTGKQYSLMVRTRFPGGVLTGAQYQVCDNLADQFGNGTLRITTRQDFQFHGVLKKNLRPTIRALNNALVTTIAACGDVARNVMAPPTPAISPLVDQVLAQARQVSLELSPKTPAYHAIWLNGQELNLSEEAKATFNDPLYGRNYLPRKFKTAFAIPPVNDIDVFTNDLGFVVIESGGLIAGYNVLVGGGLGMSHGNALTYPRLADLAGFITPDQIITTAKAVVSIHRDFGDRTNRKHARLKYIIAERGLDWFKAEFAKRAGFDLAPARPFRFIRQGDYLGWHQQTNGKWFLGLFVENGRVKDAGNYRLKTGLRQAIERFVPEVRLTASQNILLANVDAADRTGIDQILSDHGVSSQNPYSATRLASMACPALPTCGLALAESERVLPDILTRLEQLQAELALEKEELIVRMTGCPNGCSRPYTAEIALVGKAPNKYQIYLGGNEASTRLNRLYKDSVRGEDLMNELRPLLSRFRDERTPGERFGDFCARQVWTASAA